MPTKLLIFILLVGFLTACGSQPTDALASLPTEEPASPTQAVTDASASTEITSQGVTVSFATDIQPLLKSRCGNCHGGNKTEEGLNLLSYASLIQGSDNGLVVNAGSADNSLLVEQVVSQEMPKRGPKLTPPQVQLIIDWINQGALDN